MLQEAVEKIQTTNILGGNAMLLGTAITQVWVQRLELMHGHEIQRLELMYGHETQCVDS